MNNIEKAVEIFKESFMYILSVVSLVVSISLNISGKKTLALVIAAAFVVSLIYAIAITIQKKKKKKSTPQTAPVTIIDGRPVGILVLADAFRTQMDSVEVYTVKHQAIIKENNDFTVVWNYSGRCTKKEGESSFIFSIQGENNVPLEQLDCYGYDLINDPDKKQRIYASLLSPSEGGAVDDKVKKIRIPFLKQVHQNESFSIELHYTWPQAMKYDEDYYISSLSFKNDKITSYRVELIFEKIIPKWVRAYDEKGNLLRQIALSHQEKRQYFYIDDIAEPSAKSTIIYKFYREKPSP